MTDNLTTQSATLATVPATSTIATDDVGGVHYQKMKLVDGTADSATAAKVNAQGNLQTVVMGSDGVTQMEIDPVTLGPYVLLTSAQGVGVVNDLGVLIQGTGDGLGFPALGKPVGMGGVYVASPVAVDDGDRTNVLTDSVGRVSTTVANGAGAAAVNIQDGGNAITVDGTVTAAQATAANLNATVVGTGTFAVQADTELTTADLDTGVGTDTRAVVGIVGSKSGGGQLIPGDATAGLKVDLGSDNDVTVTSGSITADTELMAAAALADGAAANPTTPSVGAVGLLMNATTLDRQRAVVAGLDSTGIGIAASGLVGQLDDASTTAVTENQFAPVRISSRRALLVEGVASGTAIPISAASLPLPSGAATAALQTQPGVDIGDVTINNAAGASAVNVQDGGNSLTVDAPIGTPVNVQVGNATLAAGVVDETGTSAVDALAVGGGTPHDSVDSGNPIKIGMKAATAVPTAVAAADRANAWGDLYGRQVTQLGVPVGTEKWATAQYATTQTGTALLTPTAGKKLVITSIQIQAGGTTAGTLQVWFGGAADTTYSRGTDRAIFDGEFAPSATLKPGFAQTKESGWAAAAADDVLRVTDSAAINPLTVTVWGYEL